MASETTITARMRVTGLDQLERANSLMNKLRSGGNFKSTVAPFSKLSSELNKAAASAEKLRTALSGTREAANASNGVARIASELNRGVSGAEKLNSALRQSSESGRMLSSSSEKVASAEAKASANAEKLATAQRQSNMNMNRRTQNYKQQGESLKQSTAGWVKSAAQAEKTASSAGKIKMALGDAFAMFSVGQLGMTAVMSGVEGVKSAFKGGYESIKEQQQGQAMWATSIQDAHPNVKGSKLTLQSKKANQMILATSIKAGNDFSEANAMAKQVYSSSAGKYSGNLKRTNSLVRGMFNVQDANALNSMEMMRMRTAIGNIGDTGKMNGNIAKSLNLLDGKMTKAIRKEYKKRTGHALSKNKSGNYDWAKVDAETAYAGLDKYGNSGGIGKASQRYNSTLGGMMRSGKAALDTGMAKFETSFANRINKAFGGNGGIIGKLSGLFTNQNKISGIATSAAKSLTSLAVGIGKVGQVGMGALKAVKPFGTGFIKGFASEYKSITNGIKNAYDTIKGIGSSIKDMLPKGSGDKLKSMLSGLGGATGKVTAFLLALRGFSKIPGLGKGISKIVNPVAKLLGKIPGVGKGLSGFVRMLTGVKPERELSAAGKMQSAGDTMMQAASMMNGGPGTGYGGSDGTGTSGKRPTREQYRNGGRSVKKSWGSRLRLAGESMLAGGSHFGKGKGKGSLFSRLIGTGMVKSGGLLEKIGGSRFVSKLSKIGGLAKGAGRLFSKVGGPFQALFGAFDLAGAIGGTKAGTKGRNKAVGGSLGSTIGGLIGSAGFLIPGIGSIAGLATSAAGSWLGGKAGNLIGGMNFGDIGKKIKGSFGKVTSGIGGFMKNFDDKHLMGDFKGIGKSVGGFMKNFDNKHLMSGLSKINPFQGMKFKMPDFSKMLKGFKLPKMGNLFKGLKLPKISNPFKNWKLPKIKLPSLKGLNIKNPFKGWKFPKIKLPNFKGMLKGLNIKNPFKGWKMPKIKMPKIKLPKVKNPFKGWKIPKLKMPSMPKWLKSITGWGKGADKADKSTKKANSSTKKASKSVSDVGKKGKSSYSSLAKSASSAFKKMTSGAKGLGKKIGSSLKSVGKVGKSAFKPLTTGIKSAMRKASSAAKSGGRKIATSLKSSLKNAGKSAKTAFKSIPRDIKSAMNKAKSAARSGGRQIANAVKSGLKNVGKSAKSAFRSLPNSIKSGMNKAKSAARSGARGIVSAVKSGMSKMGSAGKAGASKLASSVKSGMSKAKSAARSGANQVVSAVKSGLAKMGSAGQSGTSRLASSVQSGMSKVSSAAKSGIAKAVSAIKSGFSKMASAASSAVGRISSSMGRIGSAASSAAGKVKSLTSAINSLHSKSITITANVKGKGAGKLATGTPGAISAFHHLAQGTPGPGSHLAGGWAANGGVKTGMYVVNDAPGSHFQEAFKMKNGLIGLFPKKRNLHVPLTEGMQVLNGEDTHKMFPHLEKGTPGAKREMVNTSPSSGGKAPTVNITVNVTADGTSGSNGDFTKLANQVANVIGEKFKVIWPRLEV